MNNAPFLLQAFAARALATKSEVTMLRADLEREGYDVDTLCEMIHEYAQVPDADRGFVVRANATEIFLQRKANTPAPALPQAVPPLALPAQDDPKSIDAPKPAGGYKPSSGRTGT
jgi:hypothetical protein